MPLYSYVNAKDDSDVIEELFPLGKQPRTIRRQGKTYRHSWCADHRGFRNTPGNWPLISEAAGVAHDQVKQAEAHSRQIGVPTHFTSDGRAIFESAAHRKRYCEAIGMYDRNAGYSDPQRN